MVVGLVALYALSRVVKAKKAQALADAEDEEYEEEEEYDDGYRYPAYFHCRRCKNRMDKKRIREQLQGLKRTGDDEEEIFD
jgi:hypothetical protein